MFTTVRWHVDVDETDKQLRCCLPAAKHQDSSYEWVSSNESIHAVLLHRSQPIIMQREFITGDVVPFQQLTTEQQRMRIGQIGNSSSWLRTFRKCKLAHYCRMRWSMADSHANGTSWQFSALFNSRNWADVRSACFHRVLCRRRGIREATVISAM